MLISIAIGYAIALVLCVASIWIRWRRRSRNPFTKRSGTIVNPPKMAVMRNAGAALVYVNEDGSVRELTEAEKNYVDTEFSPLDGARPYVKSSYSDHTAWGLRGYLPRTEVPHGVAIHPPAQQNTLQPQTPQAVADSLLQLVRRRGEN
jgi:hypothetical protein